MSEGEIAEELQGVAQALFAVDEEGAVGGEGLALPAGLMEAAGVGVDFAELPADFVVGPAFAEVAAAELGEGEVVAGAGVVWTEGDGFLVGFEGFRDAALAE